MAPGEWACVFSRRAFAAVAVALAVTVAPVRAERQIVDLHRLDAYFALFANDSNVPWKPTTVRLDTYSSAAVTFSVYQADPAEVLTAGSNARPRAIVTRGRRAIASFSFSPPGGYQFQSNFIDVQLGSREGFFVVEARRGDVGEQVWINRTRVGLVSKETPGELVLYGADLGTGRSVPRMRVQFIVGNRFVTEQTDGSGIVRWKRFPRPVFALAQWGSSYAFLSPRPQAPLPQAIIAVRTDSAVVHAGDAVRAIGFARTRNGTSFRPAGGSMTVSLRSGSTLVGEQRVPLDAAGAFSAQFVIPSSARAGEYALLAQNGSGVGGATVHVDADVGGLSLTAAAECGDGCDPNRDVPLRIHSSRGGATVRVVVVRSPHVFFGTNTDTTPWATSIWLDEQIQTDGQGDATVSVPHPTDELASTYGVHAESGAATADTRVVVPTSQAAILVTVDRDEQRVGTPLGFTVEARELATGNPLEGATVAVRLVHGASANVQTIKLDSNGRARGSFSSPLLGTNLVFASVDLGGRATDAAAVQIDAESSREVVDEGSGNVKLSVDRQMYRLGDAIRVNANLPGGQGQALLTLESAVGVDTDVVDANGGNAGASFRAGGAPGELRAGSSFVRDGAIEWAILPLQVDAPGRPDSTNPTLDAPSFAPSQIAAVTIPGASSAATLAIRISKELPSGSALFDSAPDVLAIDVATTQTSAPADESWHPWVDSTGDHAQVLGFVRRTQQPPDLSLAQSDTQPLYWNVVQSARGGVTVPVPAQSGRYTLSVLRIANDGSVGAGTTTLVVRSL
jgi:hypothetical protein